MGRQADILDALAEAKEAAKWKCETCEQPAQEDKPHCLSCELYWQDVANGVFDNE